MWAGNGKVYSLAGQHSDEVTDTILFYANGTALVLQFLEVASGEEDEQEQVSDILTYA